MDINEYMIPIVLGALILVAFFVGIKLFYNSSETKKKESASRTKIM